jgi:hypothetical protein
LLLGDSEGGGPNSNVSYIMVDFAMSSAEKDLEHISFPFIRKPMSFRK